jgi:hypothetical protein
MVWYNDSVSPTRGEWQHSLYTAMEAVFVAYLRRGWLPSAYYRRTMPFVWRYGVTHEKGT